MDDDLTFSEYLEEWLERKQTQLQPATFESYRGLIDRYLTPELGDIPLRELHKRHLEKLYTRLFVQGGLKGKPLSRRSVAYAHSVVHNVLEGAVADELIDQNPARKVALPKVDHAVNGDVGERIATWDAEQLRAFLAGTRDHPLGDLYLIGAFTGLRRGELCGLRWCDLDLERRILQVRRALTNVRRHVRLKEPKTSKPRSLHLCDTACEALGRQRAWQEAQARALGPMWSNEWDLVFTGDSGRPLVPDSISRNFKQTVEALDVPRIRLHDLRHTHATLMLQAGVPVKVVSERLGHTSVQVTLDIYAHVLPAMDSDAAAAFSAHVFAGDPSV